MLTYSILIKKSGELGLSAFRAAPLPTFFIKQLCFRARARARVRTRFSLPFLNENFWSYLALSCRLRSCTSLFLVLFRKYWNYFTKRFRENRVRTRARARARKKFFHAFLQPRLQSSMRLCSLRYNERLKHEFGIEDSPSCCSTDCVMREKCEFVV